MSQPRKRLDPLGTLALLGGVLCWGAVPVFLRALKEDVDPWTANGIRYPFAALLYWPVLLRAWFAGALGRNVLRRSGVPALLALGGQVLWAMAPYYIEASLIGFLVKGAIFWALVTSMMLFRDERALLGSLRFYGGLFLGVSGVAALAITKGALDFSVTGLGVMIMIGCGAFFGIYGTSLRYYMHDVNPVLGFGLIAQGVSAATLLLMFARGEPELLLQLSLRSWGLLLGSSLLGIGISHVLYIIAIQRLGATLATSGHLMGPFVTLALANVFLGETMSLASGIAGAVLIVGGGLLILAQERMIGPKEAP